MAGVTTANDVVCWGPGALPGFPPAAGKYVHVATSVDNTCGILASSGFVRCWPNKAAVNPFVPPGGVAFETLSSSSAYLCGVMTNGTLLCFSNT
jgi:hypothetical protein